MRTNGAKTANITLFHFLGDTRLPLKVILPFLFLDMVWHYFKNNCWVYQSSSRLCVWIINGSFYQIAFFFLSLVFWGEKITLHRFLIPWFSFSGAQAVKISRQNHETVGVEQGEMVKLVCTADQVVKACSFRSPSGESLFMFPSAKYEEGRIQHYGNSEFDCGLEITSVEDQDNGEWECAIVATADNGVSTTDQAVIKVTVSG